MPAAARPLPPPVAGVLVPGVTWYLDRRGEALLLPAQTVVPATALLEPTRSAGEYVLLALPAGDLPVDGPALPYRPTEIEQVFPLGRADVPWTPERRLGLLDLSQDWRLLFRERDAFSAWSAPDAAAALVWEAYQRSTPPRPTFRRGADRRGMRLIYPQLVPPHLCYGLSGQFLALPRNSRFDPVCARLSELVLRSPKGAEAGVGPDALGWRTALRTVAGDLETARQRQAALELLTVHGPFWECRPAWSAARQLAGGSAAR